MQTNNNKNFEIMFLSNKKKMKKEAEKLKLSKETQELWDMFKNVHQKLSLKSHLNMKEKIKLQEISPMLAKHCKLKGTFDMITS